MTEDFKKPEGLIPDVTDWANSTAEHVRQICLQQQAPCVAFSLMFFDLFAEDPWKYGIYMTYDKHDPPPEKERLRIRAALQYISEGVKRIMHGQFDEFVFSDDKGKLI